FFTTKETGRGTGLGLSVVHTIITEHDGEIHVASTPEQGTTFEFCLPAAAASGTTALNIGDLPACGLGQRILCLDDDRAIVTLTTRMLEELGYNAVGFTSPGQALQALEEAEEKFDAVITDFRMPEVSGLSFVRSVRQKFSTLPVIVVTGDIDPGETDSLLTQGDLKVLKKPYTHTQLSATVAGILQQAAMRP
ncbi:MAG: response regulator, partial [Planctomycetaceae bacterium]|nr:response regulator [Planctomycetaceae bacterium]